MSHTTMLALQGLSCMNCAQRVKKARKAAAMSNRRTLTCITPK